MIPKDGVNLQYLKAALLRRFWYVVLPFFAVFTITVGHCIKAPRLYKSSALILVQPQEVPHDFVKPTVTSSAQTRINIVTEQVMSRPVLEEIIKQHNLYPEIRAAKTMYDAVEVMRTYISVEAKRTEESRRVEPVSFEISYEGKVPAKVRDVTAAIANLFIEENLKVRERQALGTSNFLARELERTRSDLRQKEELVRQFKEKYAGLLPEQMENNYRILSQLQQHLNAINEGLQKSKDRKVLLQSQVSDLETLGASAQDHPATLEELRRQLKSLRLRYSDKHPDVIRLSVRIANLKKQQTVIPDPDSEEQGVSAQSIETHELMHVGRTDLYTQLESIDMEIEKLRKDKEKTSNQIRKYRNRIEVGPKIENMFVDLRRDYNQANETYQSLLQKKLQAELAENLERTQKGEQLMILNPANLPEKPFKPDVSKILSMGFMLALACGSGLAFLREYLDPAFWSSKELESIIELPVLVSIPVVNTKKERRWNILKRAAAAGALVSMASVLFYALFLLWKMDPTAFPFPIG